MGRLSGDPDGRVPAWFNGVITVGVVTVLVGLMKAVWQHDESGIIDTIFLIILLGLCWFGTFLKMVD